MSSNIDAEKRSREVGRNVEFEPVLRVLYAFFFRVCECLQAVKLPTEPDRSGKHTTLKRSISQTIRKPVEAYLYQFLEEAVQICILSRVPNSRFSSVLGSKL